MQRQPVIVLVDPDTLIRPLLERWLADAGCAVVVASRRPGPVAVAGDAIIANVSTRRQALALARAHQGPGWPPLILTSALFRRGLNASALAACQIDVHALLPIPFSRAELLAALHSALGRPWTGGPSQGA